MTILFKPAALRATVLYLLISCGLTIVISDYANSTLNIVGAWIVAINATLIFAMAKDKFSAIINMPRTPEGALLWMAAAGGFPGLFIARLIFNHKTSKEEFIRPMWFLLIIQIIAVLYYFIEVSPSF